MLILQDGHNSGRAIRMAVDRELVDGVIWSPADHRAENLEEKIHEVGSRNVLQAIDPQLYLARFEDANFKKLGEHNLFNVPMNARQLSAVRIPRIVESVLQFQRNFDELTHVISPTVAVESMNSRSAQSAFDLATVSIEQYDQSGEERPLMLSVAVEASLLIDEGSVFRLLDELTSFDVDGFYLLLDVLREGRPDILRKLRSHAGYLVNALTSNDYAVWVGYAGNDSLAFRGAGASATAIGIHQKLQAWAPGNWAVSTGGRAPAPRIQLNSVLGNLVIEKELQALKDVDEALFLAVADTAGRIAQEIAYGRSLADAFTPDERYEQLFESHRELDRVATDGVAASQYGEAANLLEEIERIVPISGRGGKSVVQAWATFYAER